MVKRMTRLLVLLTLLALLPAVSLAANAENRVIDSAGLFTDGEISRMQTIIERIRKQYQIDIVVLTTYNVSPTSEDAPIQDYADRYYENGGYGVGQDDAGLLYMIDMTNRAPCISTSGVMIDFINDSRLEELFDGSAPYLRSGAYGSAALSVLTNTEGYLRKGIEEGQFRYDAETGERLSGLYNKLTGSEAALGGIAGLIAALAQFFAVRGSYALKGSTYRYSAVQACRSANRKDSDEFIRQTVSRMRKPDPPAVSGGGRSGGGFSGGGRGSSVHTSSGGGSHGGGVGGRF